MIIFFERNQILYFSKKCRSSALTVFCVENGDSVTNPYDIANAFKNYFVSIAETTKNSIKHSQKHFSEYFSNENSSTIFLQPTDKYERANVSFLNSNSSWHK